MKAMSFEGKPTFDLTFDTGASRTSTAHRDDFVALQESSTGSFDGFASGLDIKGVGIVECVVLDDKGAETTLRLKACCVPGLKSVTRLVSPQGMKTSDGLKGSFTAHSNEDDPDSFAELHLRAGGHNWQRSVPLRTATVTHHNALVSGYVLVSGDQWRGHHGGHPLLPGV